MKYAALNKKYFTGEYWDFTTTVDTINGTDFKYFHVKDMQFVISSTDIIGTLFIYSEENLRFNAQIRELKSSDGKYVYEDGGESLPGYIGAGEPHFDVFGRKKGYRYNLQKGSF